MFKHFDERRKKKNYFVHSWKFIRIMLSDFFFLHFISLIYDLLDSKMCFSFFLFFFFTEISVSHRAVSTKIMFSTVSNQLGQNGDLTSNVNDDLQNFDFDFWNDDLFRTPLPFDASERGLWNGRFVPPPPRPPFLDDTVISDGLTTCDLCSWAFQDKSAFSLEGSIGKLFFDSF